MTLDASSVRLLGVIAACAAMLITSGVLVASLVIIATTGVLSDHWTESALSQFYRVLRLVELAAYAILGCSVFAAVLTPGWPRKLGVALGFLSILSLVALWLT